MFNFSNQKLKIDYNKNQLSIEGKGDILFQEKKTI